MKGNKLFLIVLITIVIGMVGVMYVAGSGDLKSWSIADAGKLRWMLGIILGSITALWFTMAHSHLKREMVLLPSWKLPVLDGFKIKWARKGIKYRHAFMYASLFFGGVLIFGLGGGFFMKLMHYIFTGLAALTTALIVIRSQKELNRIFYAVALIGAGAVWLIGLLTPVFTVYFGEFLFTIPVVVWVLSELKNVE